MRNILLYIWQLPQNILCLLLFLFYKKEKSIVYKDIKFRVNHNIKGAISLGCYAIVKRYPYNKHTWNTVKHEYGHTVQSRKWGWLYLVVIGLPSFVCCCWSNLFHTEKFGWTEQESNDWYFNLPWEKAANKYGGVETIDNG